MSEHSEDAAKIEYREALRVGLTLGLDELNAAMAALRKRMEGLETIPPYLEAALLGYQAAKDANTIKL